MAEERPTSRPCFVKNAESEDGDGWTDAIAEGQRSLAFGFEELGLGTNGERRGRNSSEKQKQVEVHQSEILIGKRLHGISVSQFYPLACDSNSRAHTSSYFLEIVGNCT